ncbi:MAG: glycosyltransferase [Anaerolineales bacterium]|nr:glycosyltransferase [Chloroflexota bacterium]MBL6982359.1 glycosyltransferase [Anaerolineales bacterium]
MNRLHIAHFTNIYHPVINGVVRSVSAFKNAFDEMGHNTFVFTHHEGDYVDDEPFVFRYPSFEIHPSIDFPAVIPVSPFVDKIIPNLKLDVLHAHHPFLLGQTAATKAQKLGLPLVFTFHTQYREYSHYLPLPQPAVQDFAKNMIHIWLCEYIKHCQHIVVPSEGMRKILVDDYGLNEGCSVIPTGIDLTPYQQLDGRTIRNQRGWGDEKVIISVGRLTQEKNWTTLIDAFGRAFKNQSDHRLAIIGDGPERDDLQQLAQKLGIATQVDFLGRVPFEDIPHYLAAADCFAFASITETQGLVTLEAIAAGLPVVAVDATGTSDIVQDGIEGFVTENKSEALANSLRSMLENPEHLYKFRNAALLRAKFFDIRKQAKRLEEVYYLAIEDHKRGRFVKIEGEKHLVPKIIDAVIAQNTVVHPM